MSTDITVIYIAGAGRSGTTILDRILGTIEGVESLNQVYPLGEPERRHCACGEEMSSCLFWQKVFEHSTVLPERMDELLRLRERVDHTRYLPLLLTSVGRRILDPSLSRYLEMLQDVYEALAEAAKKQILVDSSKVTSRAFLLGMISTINVYVIHMVRDVRGVIYSWQKKKKRKGGYLTGPGTANVGKFWTLNNLSSEVLGFWLPYQRVKYEEFGRRPKEEVARIRRRIQPIANRRGDFIDSDVVRLRKNHSISGNPDRFQSGRTSIRLDEEWKRELDECTERLWRVVTYPLLRRYGYV